MVATQAQAERSYGTWFTSDTGTDLLNGPWLETYGSGESGSPGTLAAGEVFMAIADYSVLWLFWLRFGIGLTVIGHSKGIPPKETKHCGYPSKNLMVFLP